MGAILTASNLLSFSRVPLVALVVYFLSFNTPEYNLTAILFSLVAILTDVFDGTLARWRGSVTTLGKYLDPIADKICTLTLTVYFAFYRGNLPQAFAYLIIGKDLFIVIGGGILLLKSIEVQADKPGKYAMLTVAALFLCLGFNLDTQALWLVWLSSAFALQAGVFYTLKFFKLLKTAQGQSRRR